MVCYAPWQDEVEKHLCERVSKPESKYPFRSCVRIHNKLLKEGVIYGIQDLHLRIKFYIKPLYCGGFPLRGTRACFGL